VKNAELCRKSFAKNPAEFPRENGVKQAAKKLSAFPLRD